MSGTGDGVLPRLCGRADTRRLARAVFDPIRAWLASARAADMLTSRLVSVIGCIAPDVSVLSQCAYVRPGTGGADRAETGSVARGRPRTANRNGARRITAGMRTTIHAEP